VSGVAMALAWMQEGWRRRRRRRRLASGRNIASNYIFIVNFGSWHSLSL